MCGDVTTMQVELEDPTMEAVLEQAELVRIPPRKLLSLVIRDVFAFAKASGQSIVEMVPDCPAPKSKAFN